MNVSVVVQSKASPQRFSALIHKLVDQGSFHLEPVEFYERWGKSVPELPHHEIEIVEPDDRFFNQHTLHIHRSRKTGKPFVCYPQRMKTIEQAIAVFQTWCLGSVATVVEGVDLNTLYTQECGNNTELMKEVLRQRYEIFVDG